MAGEVSGSAPLNPQAKADINEALGKGGADSLRPTPGDVMGGLSISEETANQRESLNTDSRFADIKAELVNAWELVHGNRRDQQGEFQDYLYGSPPDLKKGQKPVTLDDRAKQVFRDRFPEEAKIYDERERVRVYDNPNEDPALKAIEEEILQRTNTDREVSQSRINYGEIWRKVHQLQSMRAWDAFTKQYPEKAVAYREKFGPLQQAFESQERARKTQEQQGLTETSQPQTLDNDPIFRNFMDDPQSGLNARVWDGVSVDQGLTSAQYLKRAEAVKLQMLQEFASTHPDIYAKFKKEEVTGGLSLPIEPNEAAGNLAASPDKIAPDVGPQPQVLPEQVKPFDPTALLQMDNIGVDDFFGLDQEQTYNTIRRLVTHHDESIRKRTEKILSLISGGKDNFLKDNPEVATINLT